MAEAGASDEGLVDPITGDIPMFVDRYDGHEALANSAAMKLAGVDAKTPDVPGGVIVRDASGNPTGIFKDAAMPLIYKVVPPMTHRTAASCCSPRNETCGVAGSHKRAAHEPGICGRRCLFGARRKRRAHHAHLRSADGNGLGDQAKVGIRRAWGSSYLRLGAVKGYADGSLGSRTAYMFEPFTTTPATAGC
jgi:Predicted metal-dependent hydrolase with the TIM-barrel fold